MTQSGLEQRTLPGLPDSEQRYGGAPTDAGRLTALIEALRDGWQANADELTVLIEALRADPAAQAELHRMAAAVRDRVYGPRVFFRGLIEFSNFCQNDCLYCGIRNSSHVRRYRLDRDEILACCAIGHRLGYRTFVLQSGEDPAYDDDEICAIVQAIVATYPDCAITLSIGEKSRSSYERYFAAGAHRYLLRHETATESHYHQLHPTDLSLANRLRCLADLKEIGFQVGAGFMVGSPGQTARHLANDLVYLRSLEPEMVGIGPFLPASGTPFADQPSGTVADTLMMVALTRLILPKALIPATTALGSLDGIGREKGLLAGANVVMPNLSPTAYRKDYSLYDGKICTGDEAAECRVCIEQRIRRVGFVPDLSRGDHFDYRY